MGENWRGVKPSNQTGMLDGEDASEETAKKATTTDEKAPPKGAQNLMTKTHPRNPTQLSKVPLSGYFNQPCTTHNPRPDGNMVGHIKIRSKTADVAGYSKFKINKNLHLY
jgi:hypothetical protein